MASQYSLLNDYAAEGEDSVSPGYVCSTSACVVAIWPFKNPTTYKRTGGADGNGGSGSNTAVDALALNQVIILDSEIVSASVQSSKQSYVGSASIQLLPGTHNYIYETNAGDWMMVWMVNNEEDRLSLRSLIASSAQINDFYSGLKFVGRVQSVRQSLNQSPGGMREVTYTIQGASFKELDAMIYYDPLLQQQVDGWADYYARLGQTIDKFILFNENGLDPATAIEFFLDLNVGSGVAENTFSNFHEQNSPTTGQNIQPTAGTTNEAAPFGYCVPQLIGTVLGQTGASINSAMSYGSLLDSIIGVQTYQDVQNINTSNKGGLAFNPGLRNSGSNRFRTVGGNLLGQFLPEQPQFSNIPLWSHIMAYVNPAVNEMYATLRPDNTGHIQLTLTVRQYPFTSAIIANANNGGIVRTGTDNAEAWYPVTPYLSMPRWEIDPTLVESHDLGKSDSLRYNFVLIVGDLVQAVNEIADVGSRIRNPPRTDVLDIGRNGLRMYPHQKVKCSQYDFIQNLPGVWQQLVADFAQGMQMTISGTITMLGVQAPIAVGDNVEYEGNVYHIEGLTHHWSISNGERDFKTMVQVSTGMLSAPQVQTTQQFPDIALYIPSTSDALQTDVPGLTVFDTTPTNKYSNPNEPVNNSTANAGDPTGLGF